MPPTPLELSTLGHRIRHQRVAHGLTLDELGERVGVAGSQLSLIENGKREPKLSLLQAIATETGVQVTDLLSSEPPNRRAALEIELERAQRGSVFRQLGIAPGQGHQEHERRHASSRSSGLHRELQRREREAIATPEEARRANTELRLKMRDVDNYLPEIEKLAEKQLKSAGHVSGALTHRTVSIMAEQLGFELLYVSDLPHSARSVTDLEHGRIYLPPASIPGGHGLRSMALQAMAHRLLGHQRPTDYADFLQQRLEINYFAAACLMPETASVAFLAQAKKDRNLAVEDFRDAFGTTHESAGMRLTNLATRHLDIPLHFLRVDGSGAITRVYENDDLPLPMDVTGAVDGQIACRKWSARSAFDEQNRTTEHYQYTDTPAGHVLVLDADRHDLGRRVLDHGRRAVRRREVVPRPRERRSAPSRRAPTSRAAVGRRATSPRAGRARRGRARGCTCRCSRRSPAAPSPASTTTRCTSSSTGTSEPPLGYARAETPPPGAGRVVPRSRAPSPDAFPGSTIAFLGAVGSDAASGRDEGAVALERGGDLGVGRGIRREQLGDRIVGVPSDRERVRPDADDLAACDEQRAHHAVHAGTDRPQELRRARHRAVDVREVVLLERRQRHDLGGRRAAARRGSGHDIHRLAVVGEDLQAIGCRFRRRSGRPRAGAPSTTRSRATPAGPCEAM